MNSESTVVIRRPCAEVFAYIADISNDVNWRTGITKSGLRSEPPVAVGSIGYAANDKMETVYRVVTLDPDRVDWEFIEGPLVGRGGYRLEEVGEGTRFTLVADVKPTGAMKLLGPLFSWIGSRQNQADVEKIRDILESSDAQE